MNENTSPVRRRLLVGIGTSAAAGLAVWRWAGGGPERVAAVGSEVAGDGATLALGPTASPVDGAAELPVRERFHAELNSTFQVVGGPVCRLVKVSEVTVTAGPKARYAGYTLLFEAPLEYVAEPAAVKLLHAKLGAMELYLTAVGRPEGFSWLEAVCSCEI
jgi:hypothetical protein